MFGISFTEVLLILAVALVVVGPQKLPSLLGTVGTYIGKLRRLATDMRRQTGIDDILRQEGLSGGLNELRNLMRTDGLSGGSPRRAPTAVRDPYEAIEYDRTREYPVEGADAYGAIPEDLADGLAESGAPEHRGAIAREWDDSVRTVRDLREWRRREDPTRGKGNRLTTAPPDDHAMTFWEHLEELRKRLVYMAVAFTLGAAIAWVYREPMLAWLTAPFVRAWSEGSIEGRAALHFPAPQSLFISYIKLALLGGFVLALPILLYQVWAFVSPGLYSREKRFAIPFVVSSCALFGGGAYFGWRFAFPIAFEYLLGFGGPIGDTGMVVEPTVMVEEYVAFVSQMLLAFGVVFELPVVVFFLSVAGIVNHRHLIKFSRYFIVIAFIVAAIFTPPDPTSQLLLAVPLCVLYFISIGIAWLVGRRRAA